MHALFPKCHWSLVLIFSHSVSSFFFLLLLLEKNLTSHYIMWPITFHDKRMNRNGLKLFGKKRVILRSIFVVIYTHIGHQKSKFKGEEKILFLLISKESF